MQKKNFDHKYKVKPGLSIRNEDLYRRYRNNSLNISGNQSGHSLDHTLLDYTRMEKGEQLDSLQKTIQEAEKLRSK